MKKLLSILLAGTMLISAVPMISVSAQTDSTQTYESVSTQQASTESTTVATEITEPTAETTVPDTESDKPIAKEKKEKTYKKFTYSVQGKAVTIKKYNGSAKSVKIPSEIEGKKVRVIGKKSFYKNKTLKKVTIPDSVYEIRAYTFYNCVKLNKVSIGKNVDKIGESAFNGCKSLKKFKIPSQVTKLNYDVFARTGIKSLHIGKNIKNILPSSFYNMTNKPLEKITVSKKNKHYSSENGVLYNKKKTRLILCPPSLNRKSLTLPSSVRIIGDDAFEFNKNLRTVKLPNKLKLIYPGAFCDCKNLNEITIPKSVYEIYEYAFSGCSKLTKVTILNKDANIEEFAFENSGFKSVEVAHSISEGFWGCKKLKKITILPNVTDIAPKQFFNCPKLKTVTIPPTVKRIWNKAFGYRYKRINGIWKIVKVKGFTIKGKKNSPAHKYAKKNNFKFVVLKK